MGILGLPDAFFTPSYVKSDMAEGTAEELFKICAWSCNQLLTGITDEVDWLGCPREGGKQWIANRYRGALVQIRGDWELFANVLNLASWSNQNNMCPMLSGFACFAWFIIYRLFARCWMETHAPHTRFMA